MRFASLALLLVGLSLGGFSTAQQRLVVNGVTIEGYAPGLVPGNAYAPAAPLARALGATYTYSFGADTATFELGGTFLSVPVFESVSAAAGKTRPLLVNGRPQEATEGGVRTESGVFVPVRAVARALGGTVAYLASENTVMVTFPRATLLSVTPPGPGEDARFVFTFSARVPVLERAAQAPPDPPPNTDNTVRFHFGRTDLAQEEAQGEWRGEGFGATLRAAAGGVDFELTHAQDLRVTSFAAPQGAGFALVVDLVPEGEGAGGLNSGASREAPVIVIDPGHGGEDRGLVFAEAGPDSGGALVGEAGESESALTLAFAKRLEAALAARGYSSRLTREADTSPLLERRAAAGTGADLFVSLHAAPLPAGRFNLYFLGAEDVANGVGNLSSPLRREAAAAANASGDPGTNPVERELLRRLAPDPAAGERYARAVSGVLGGTLTPQTVKSEPLFVLGGAAGRGLLLELSPQDLVSESLPAALADAVVALLRSEGATTRERTIQRTTQRAAR